MHNQLPGALVVVVEIDVAEVVVSVDVSAVVDAVTSVVVAINSKFYIALRRNFFGYRQFIIAGILISLHQSKIPNCAL